MLNSAKLIMEACMRKRRHTWTEKMNLLINLVTRPSWVSRIWVRDYSLTLPETRTCRESRVVCCRGYAHFSSVWSYVHINYTQFSPEHMSIFHKYLMRPSLWRILNCTLKLPNQLQEPLLSFIAFTFVIWVNNGPNNATKELLALFFCKAIQ